MKNISKMLLKIGAVCLSASLFISCGKEAEKTNEIVKITALNANKEETEVEVKYDAQRLVLLDLAALDVIDYLGLGNRVVGVASTSIDYLESYTDTSKYPNVGTIKTPDVEAVNNVDPDVIFIGGRLSSFYDELSKIAPVVYLSTTADDLVGSTINNAKKIASIFGLESKIEETSTAYDQRIETLRNAANSQTAIVGMVTGGKFNVLGNDSRCSIIGTTIGFNNLGTQYTQETSTHGDTASFEYIAKENPQWIFVLDRDAAINTEGATPARDVLNNDLVNGTTAGQNNHIVVLAHSNVWYTAEGGLQALDVMIADLESEILA